MAELRRYATAALVAVAVVGCGPKEVTSADVPAKDPYASLPPAQKVDAIRQDQTMNEMDKHQKISDAQKAAGLPVTGQ